MGMCAEIIAIGPYTKSIAGFLDYSAERYDATREGSVISRRLFGINEGSTLSREFAAHLGISDPWDFNQHKITNADIDFIGLKAFGHMYNQYADEIKIFEMLVKVGFEFHFRPEG
jgi:hypothetical protein